MKYIIKSDSPQNFQKWVDENDEKLQELSAGDDIWTAFKSNSEERKALQHSLLNEQGFICAYCGTRIGKHEGETFSVEHFIAKSDLKELTLRYTNLLGCCKLSQREVAHKTQVFPIEGKPQLTKLTDIADWLDVSVENIKENTGLPKKYNENTDLQEINKSKPDAFKIKELHFKANIHHCDDTKHSSTKKIINPTHEGCENHFVYEEIKYKSGKVGCSVNLPNEEGLVKDTVNLLNLNAINLCENRLKAYQLGYNLGQLYVNEGYDEIQIKDIIEQEIYQKKQDIKDSFYKFDEFCFVTASIIRSFWGIKA